MYVCTVQGAPHTLGVRVFMRDADVHEAVATGGGGADNDDDGGGGGGGGGGVVVVVVVVWWWCGGGGGDKDNKHHAVDDIIHDTPVHTLCRGVLHAADADGETPMHKAAAASNALLVACLARAGGSVATLSRDGATPLALSVRGGDIECVRACACGHDAKEAAFEVDRSSGR